MTDKVKYRIVGALVLISLGIIFIPAWLEPQEEWWVDKDTKVPASPGIEPVTVTETISPQDIAVAKPATEAYRSLDEEVDVSQEPENDKTIERPVIAENGLPESWLVQAASFLEKEKADAFVEQLLLDKYRAFSREVTVGEDEVTRVFIGPKLQQSKALEVKKKIDEKYNLSSRIVRFQ